MSQHLRRCLNALFSLFVIMGILAFETNLNLPLAKGQSTAPDSSTNNSPLETGAWSMAGANPERTSWTPEEVRGKLSPIWYKPFEAYISQKVQVIAAYNTIYVATASGLYAIDATTGAERWTYPTALPLGHSPTVADGVVYVGGFDHKLHAIDAITGTSHWTFEAGAGFHTNPLVVSGKVYAGNRDGSFYAIHAQGSNAGKLAWKYNVGAPILYSAAYKDDVIFFAAEDSHAYALNSQTGSLVWKSAKLPGAGFHSWWPVVYRDRVIFSGSNNYRFSGLGSKALAHRDLEDVYPNHETNPRGTRLGAVGTQPGDWANGTVTIDATRSLDYLTAKPWRKTYFVLDRFTGQERETAPVLWTGSDGAGNRYPPVVGGDGVIYQQNNYLSSPNIAGGHISGWQIGTPYISVVSSDWGAIDEPHAYAAGGNLIYWGVCCDRQGGAFDISLPNTQWANGGGIDKEREWIYYSYGSGSTGGSHLSNKMPGYSQFYTGSTDRTDVSPYGSFGKNGVYGWHADLNPPIPYQGKVYMFRGNSLIALGTSQKAATALPMALQGEALQNSIAPQDRSSLQSNLADEIEKILTAGHLRPGYHSHGIFDLNSEKTCGDKLVDYWHQPADTLITLIQALPHLPSDTQVRVKEYLQSEFETYPPYAYNHIGWKDGASREIFDLPPDVESVKQNHPAAKVSSGFIWKRSPYAFYALWKYAEISGTADAILRASSNTFAEEFGRQPTDAILQKMPHVHNAYIAGYLGFLELEKLAEKPESADVRQELNRLLELRANTFSKDSVYADATDMGSKYCRTLNVANNFVYLVPELADYLRINALDKVQAALDEYVTLAPYWFVSFAEEGFGENYTAPLYDGYAVFMAKALIMQESGQALTRYLDVPGFARGDLFYIQKLVATIESYDSSPGEPSVPPIGATFPHSIFLPAVAH